MVPDLLKPLLFSLLTPSATPEDYRCVSGIIKGNPFFSCGFIVEYVLKYRRPQLIPQFVVRGTRRYMRLQIIKLNQIEYSVAINKLVTLCIKNCILLAYFCKVNWLVVIKCIKLVCIVSLEFSPEAEWVLTRSAGTGGAAGE